MTTNLIPVSEIISLEDIPKDLSFVKEELTSVFSKLFIQNLQSSLGFDREYAGYSFDLVSNNRIAIEIPGTNSIALVFNPRLEEADITELPISIGYSLGILKYIQGVKIGTFDFTNTKSFFDILIVITGADDASLLYNLIHSFYQWDSIEDSDIINELPETEEEDSSPYRKFVNDFNVRFNPNIPLILDADWESGEVVVNILEQLSSNGNDFDIKTLLYYEYIVDLNLNTSINRIETIFNSYIDNFNIGFISDILIPKLSASLQYINLALEFPRTVLKPIDPVTNEVIEDEAVKSQLLFNVGSLSFNTDTGFEFENLSEFSFRKSEIANTGITLDFSGAKIDLSRNTNIPEADAAGYPKDFVGIFIESATIGLPAFWQKDSSRSNAEIFGENLLIGTGGISGTVGLRALDPSSGVAPLLHTKFGPEGKGFEITLDNFDLTFHQNAIVSSDINGRLILPNKFKPVNESGQPVNGELVIGVNISIDRDGFAVTAKPLGQPITFNISDVANFTINSLQVGKEEDRFYIDASGKIKIIYDQPPLNSFLPEAIDIQRLRIWSDGQIEFRGTGGEIKLRKPLSLRFPPVEMSVTAIHLGSYEGFHNGILRKYMYFGFDGTLSINPGGIDGKGSGIKFYFTQDNDPEAGRERHVFMRIQTIEIDLILPEKNPGLTLQGILSMRDPEPTSAIPDPGPEYIGSVTFELNKLKMAGSAGMRLNPKVPAFLVDAALELSTPIVLGATGLGIYGFRGLVGMNYVASKTKIGLDANARWYDYYKKKVPPVNREGIDIGKFDLNKKGFSFGAGVSLATSADQGRAFSSKLFLLLSLPGAFLLQGQAQVVKKQRLQLTDPNDPPFSLMLAVDDRSFSVTIGVNFVMPNDSSESPGDKGSVLDREYGYTYKEAA